MSRKNLHIALLADENWQNLSAEEKKKIYKSVKSGSKIKLNKLSSLFETLIDKINED
jgi:hypothetical protein